MWTQSLEPDGIGDAGSKPVMGDVISDAGTKPETGDVTGKQALAQLLYSFNNRDPLAATLQAICSQTRLTALKEVTVTTI